MLLSCCFRRLIGPSPGLQRVSPIEKLVRCTVRRGRMAPMATDKKPLPSDAFVFFGATGDLAYKKIFPALQAHGAARRLDVPDHRRGQGRAGRSTSWSSARAPASTEHGGGSTRPLREARRAAALRRRRL